MRDIHDHPISRSDFVCLAISFMGAVIAVVAAFSVYTSQTGISGSWLWRLPGLVLLEWGLLGLIIFIAAYLSFRLRSTAWMRAAWFITGMFIPLNILGILSIGPYVLISFLLFLISTVLLALPRHPKWLGEIGLLLLGAMVNLGLLMLMIFVSNPGAL